MKYVGFLKLENDRVYEGVTGSNSMYMALQFKLTISAPIYMDLGGKPDGILSVRILTLRLLYYISFYFINVIITRNSLPLYQHLAESQ